MPVVEPKDPAEVVAYMERVAKHMEAEAGVDLSSYVRGYRAAIRDIKLHLGVEE